MARATFDRVGGYRDSLAEDLLFIYDHVEAHAKSGGGSGVGGAVASAGSGGTVTKTEKKKEEGGAAAADGACGGDNSGGAQIAVPTLPPALVKVDQVLLEYTYRGSESLTPRVSKDLLRTIRIAALQRQVLATPRWKDGFYIWGKPMSQHDDASHSCRALVPPTAILSAFCHPFFRCILRRLTISNKQTNKQTCPGRNAFFYDGLHGGMAWMVYTAAF